MSWGFWFYAIVAALSAFGYAHRIDEGARVLDRDGKCVHIYKPAGLILHMAFSLFVLYLVAN